MENGNNISRPFDVFLSHSHMYADWVENLAIKLKDKVGLNIWLDKWRLIPGRPFITGMSNGMEQAKSCAVCIGVHSPKGWFRTEIHKALNQQAKDPTFAVIPVLLPDAEDINVNEFLELNTWVDYRKHDPEYAFYVLVCAIKGIEPNNWGLEKAKIADTTKSIISQNTEDALPSQSLAAKLHQLSLLEQQGLIDPETAREKRHQLLDNL